MPTLALRPYLVAIRDDQTGRIRYLGPGGRLVHRRSAAALLVPEVAEQFALSVNELDAGRSTASAKPL